MKLVQIESNIDSNGQLVVPALLLRGMGLGPGDTVRLAYTAVDSASDSNTYKKFMLMPGKSYADFDLTVPHELLEEAEIPEDADLEVICAKGAVIITEGDILDDLPDDLRLLFEDLDIDPETVRDVMKSGDLVTDK
jgi:bifunctional DNA-binding transcriptional regulator/antitoxin component of YhaV-PrlF toxin-antitoxin module